MIFIFFFQGSSSPTPTVVHQATVQATAVDTTIPARAIP